MTFYRTYIMKKSNVSIEQMRERQTKGIAVNKWRKRIFFWLCAAVIVSSAFFLAGGQITAGDMLIITLITAGPSVFGCWAMCHIIKEEYSTVTLGEEKITLKDGYENILIEAKYPDIRYAEIKLLRAAIERTSGRASGRWEIAPFICLYTDYMQVQSESWESEYFNKYNRVIVFPYVPEAWEILNGKIEKGKIAEWDEDGSMARAAIRAIDYDAVGYAQTVMMYGNEELGSQYYRKKFREFICLHTQRQEIADGAKKREYDWQYDRVMIFAYDEEAWRTILKKIPAQRIKERKQ